MERLRPLVEKCLEKYLRPIEKPDKYKNKLMRQRYFFIFRKLKNKVTCFFYKKYFYKQHQAEIY